MIRKAWPLDLIAQAGGQAKLALSRVTESLAKLPKVMGGGAGQLYLSPYTARIFDSAEKAAEKAWRQLCHSGTAAFGHCCREGERGGQGAR